MKGNLGSEVLLSVEILSEDNFVTIDSLRAPAYTWSARRYQPTALPYPNVGDYKGRIGLSLPTAYPSTVGYEANEGNM
jgi:hypothetical protein